MHVGCGCNPSILFIPRLATLLPAVDSVWQQALRHVVATMVASRTHVTTVEVQRREFAYVSEEWKVYG
jgi:hypothetical protein